MKTNVQPITTPLTFNHNTPMKIKKTTKNAQN